MPTRGGALWDATDAAPVDPSGRSPGAPDSDASAWTVPDGSDSLAAFLDGLHRLSIDGGMGLSSPAPASPPSTMLSNGLNADAGVAQLVSALASVPESRSSYFATPFTAPPSDPSVQAVIAAEVR